MFRLLLALVVASAMSVAQAQDHQIVIVTSDQPSDAGARLLEWFRSDARLSALRAKVHYHEFTPSNPLYIERYRQSLPASDLPVIAMATSEGGVYYKSSGRGIPSSASSLFNAMGSAYKQFREATTANDCPTCPKQPVAPERPREPILPRLVDEAIPDTVTIEPHIDVPDSAVIAAAVVIGLVVLGGCAVVLLIGVAVVVFLLRS